MAKIKGCAQKAGRTKKQRRGTARRGGSEATDAAEEAPRRKNRRVDYRSATKQIGPTKTGAGLKHLLSHPRRSFFFFNHPHRRIRALLSHDLGCIDVLTPYTGCEPKARNNGSHLWSDSTDACGRKALASYQRKSETRNSVAPERADDFDVKKWDIVGVDKGAQAESV